jgi:hypothetical protein
MATGNEPRSWKPRQKVERRDIADVRYWSWTFGVAEREFLRAINTGRPIAKSPTPASATRHG